MMNLIKFKEYAHLTYMKMKNGVLEEDLQVNLTTVSIEKEI